MGGISSYHIFRSKQNAVQFDIASIHISSKPGATNGVRNAMVLDVRRKRHSAIDFIHDSILAANGLQAVQWSKSLYERTSRRQRASGGSDTG